MRRSNRGILTACICFVALTNIQCGQDIGRDETDGPTLTIDSDDGSEPPSLRSRGCRSPPHRRGGHTPHQPAFQGQLSCSPPASAGNAE